MHKSQTLKISEQLQRATWKLYCCGRAQERRMRWGNYEARWNQSPDATESAHTSAAVPTFWSDSKVQLGRYGYHLMSGLSYWTSYWQQRWGVKNLFFPAKRIQNIDKQRTVFIRMQFSPHLWVCFLWKTFSSSSLGKVTQNKHLQLELRNVWTFHFQNNNSTIT